MEAGLLILPARLHSHLNRSKGHAQDHDSSQSDANNSESIPLTGSRECSGPAPSRRAPLFQPGRISKQRLI